MPIIAQFGIMPQTASLFVNSPTMQAVNGTMYSNVYSAFSLTFVVPFIGIGAIVIAIFIAVATKKWVKVSGGE